MKDNTVLQTHYDVVIIGARCAGASTGMLLARHGLRVLVLDRSRYGSDTLSTHALMRGGVLQLRRWGVLDGLVDAGTPAVQTTSFHYGDEVVDIKIKPRDGVDALYAPRRTILDALLVDAARKAGAVVQHETRLIDLIRSRGGRVRGVVAKGQNGRLARISADIVVGADGLRSTLGALVGAEPYRSCSHSACSVFGYWVGLENNGYHWYYRPGVSAGAIPTNEGLTLVFVSVPSDRFRDQIASSVATGYHQVLEETAPDLAQTVAGAARIGGFRSFPGRPGYLRRSWGPGWALVGDAGYFRDPITAHGITDALRDAEFLSRAILRGSDQGLADYQSLRDDLSIGMLEASDDIASFKWDLAEVQERHLFFSREMGREVEALNQLHQAAFDREEQTA